MSDTAIRPYRVDIPPGRPGRPGRAAAPTDLLAGDVRQFFAKLV